MRHRGCSQRCQSPFQSARPEFCCVRLPKPCAGGESALGGIVRSGHFLPVAFWTGCALSMFYLLLVPRGSWRQAGVTAPLASGTFFIALQSFCLAGTIGYFGDAARVNVVYALRGLWGVVFAFALAKRFDMREQHASRQTMMSRLAGAVLLTTAVVLALFS